MSSLVTPLVWRLGIETPIIQAPLAGGGDTPELVAAVCEAGGLGFVGAAYLAPGEILAAGREVRSLTSRPFGINLFAPWPEPDAINVTNAITSVSPYFEELGLQPPTAPGRGQPRFDEQLEAVLQTDAAVFSFTFGLPPQNAMEALRKRGLFVMGTATTVEEARLLEEHGVDAVVVQGAEAGGHRGTFAGPFDQAMIGTMALTPQIADAVDVPVVASGGIADGRGVAAALMLGADAVQIGTAFLTTDEAGVPPAYKTKLLGVDADKTSITRAFSGRPARGLNNRFIQEMDAKGADAVLPFPLQNELTRPLRQAAARKGNVEFLSLWAGQASALARRQPAAALVQRLINEAHAALASAPLNGGTRA